MAEGRRQDEENLRALESLSGAARGAPSPRGSRPVGPGASGRPARVSTPSSPKPAPPAPPKHGSSPDEPLRLAPAPEPVRVTRASNLGPAVTAADEAEPVFRCLRCGYPMKDAATPRCNECGRTYDRGVLEYWFSGEEQARFEHVMWLALGCLFLKLLLLPELRWVARVAAGIVLAWGSHVAMRGKAEGPGRYCGIGGVAAGAVMFIGLAWLPNTLPYYTFDMIGGCLMLLAALHNPVGGHVGGVLAARQLTPVLLFLIPIFSLACWQAGQAGTTLPGAPTTGSGPTLLPIFTPAFWQQYPPFNFLLPYLASIALWVYVWRVLAGVRKILFSPVAHDED